MNVTVRLGAKAHTLLKYREIGGADFGPEPTDDDILGWALDYSSSEVLQEAALVACAALVRPVKETKTYTDFEFVGSPEVVARAVRIVQDYLDDFVENYEWSYGDRDAEARKEAQAAERAINKLAAALAAA